MKYSKTLPTSAGWYWVKDTKNDNRFVCEVVNVAGFFGIVVGTVGLTVQLDVRNMVDKGYEFAGPIQEPEDVND